MKVYDGKLFMLQNAEQSFDETRTLSVHGIPVTVRDVCTESGPDERPIAFWHGYGQTTACYEDVMQSIATQNRRVIALECGHWTKTSAKKDDVPVRLKPELFPRVLDALDIDAVDSVGHSHGCNVQTYEALDNPDRFGDLVYCMPAGFTGKKSTSVLMWKLLRERWAHKARNRLRVFRDAQYAKRYYRSHTEGIRYLLGNPFHALREGRSVAHCPLVPAVQQLIESYSKNVALVMGKNELLFPLEEIQQSADTLAVDQEDRYTISSGHNGHIDAHQELSGTIITAFHTLRRHYRGVTQRERLAM